jgi:hypothetical protein
MVEMSSRSAQRLVGDNMSLGDRQKDSNIEWTERTIY